ncbi:MAG: hypothetical protein AAF414_18910 [Pseudomonadota bacterium]
MISLSLPRPDYQGDKTNDTIVEIRAETKRIGPGRVDHRLVLDASSSGRPLWSKEVVFLVDAPFDIPDLKNLDPFVIAALFPTMEVGGTLRVHGAVSRTLIRNVLDYQSVWHLVSPDLFKPFDLEVETVDDSPVEQRASRPRTILAFSAGVDSMLALCRNASGDTGEAGYQIDAGMLIRGMGVAPGSRQDPVELTEDRRRICARWDVPLAVIDTDVYEITEKPLAMFGSWLSACLTLFSGSFDVGLIGSSEVWYAPGWEIWGSHPLLDPMLSSGQMAIRNDEGLFERAEKVALLARYPRALEDLRVCFNGQEGMPNCCRCEKCVRTMLGFIASGNEVPPAFPKPLRLQDVGRDMRSELGLKWTPQTLECARQSGTLDHPAIKLLRRRYRVKLVKFTIKRWVRRLITGKKPSRLHILDSLYPIPKRAFSASRGPLTDGD